MKDNTTITLVAIGAGALLLYLVYANKNKAKTSITQSQIGANVAAQQNYLAAQNQSQENLISGALSGVALLGGLVTGQPVGVSPVNEMPPPYNPFGSQSDSFGTTMFAPTF